MIAPNMKAAILAVGSELLSTDRLDTNSLALTAVLERHGVVLGKKAVVGDDAETIAGEMRHLAADHDLLLVSGGLGPTEDDRTRDALALFAERPLVRDESIVQGIRERFRAFGRVMPEVNARQGDLVSGARAIANPRGTAPGQHLETESTHVMLFPGVPRELEGMIEETLEPFLAQRTPSGAFKIRRELVIACLPESEVEQRLAPIYQAMDAEPSDVKDAVELGVFAKPAEIRVRFEGPASQEALIEDLVAKAANRLGDAVYAQGAAPAPLEQVLGELLKARGHVLVCAESCTGGLLSQRLTGIPGSSAWFLGGVVTYTNELKSELLGVDPQSFLTDGAVSERVAEEMALGASRELADERPCWAISVTGIAGPGGATPGKPVGTVCLAIAGPPGRWNSRGCVSSRMQFPGDRKTVRWRSSQWGFEGLRGALLDKVPWSTLALREGADLP